MKKAVLKSLIRVENVTRTYLTSGGPVHALKGVNLTVSSGSFIALKGRSGSGKTTLLNLIGGLDQPTGGEVYFTDQPLSQLDDMGRTDLRRDHMGFVFQSFALLPTYSAFENVEFSLRLAGKGVNESHQRVIQCLKAVGLSNRMHSRPDELSGGQQQRVAIARAMVNHPTLILADEPTGELDTTTTRQVLTLLRRLVDHEGMTLIVTSHDPLIDEVADRVYELKDGMIFDNANK
jgi:putative ABC transport system ATP-binding protein